MFSLSDKIPGYLLGKYQLTATVVFAALFSVVFILLSLPFSHNAWFQLGTNESFGFTLGFFIIALLVVIASKRYLYIKGTPEMTYLQYIGWNMVEVVIISLLYAFFTVEGDAYGIIDMENTPFLPIFMEAVLVTFVALGIPYIVAGLYFAIEDKNNTIRLMNYGNVVSDEQIPAHKEKRITLFDNNGVLKFSINSENLYFIESDDNYIQVWYMNTSGEMKQYMLRCRLKTIEDSFTDSGLVRCHRKFIVNMDKVATLRAEAAGYFIDLDIDSIDPIPVSKTYEETVLSRFNSR